MMKDVESVSHLQSFSKNSVSRLTVIHNCWKCVSRRYIFIYCYIPILSIYLIFAVLCGMHRLYRSYTGLHHFVFTYFRIWTGAVENDILLTWNVSLRRISNILNAIKFMHTFQLSINLP